MRILAVAIAVILAAQSALAQDSKPGYSKDNLQRTFSAHMIELPDRPEPTVRFRFGSIEFHALGVDWRILYLPVVMPVSGTEPVTVRQLPDPFKLTGVQIAGARPYEPETRRSELRAELKRIRRVTR
jgi:hypothetical protein